MSSGTLLQLIANSCIIIHSKFKNLSTYIMQALANMNGRVAYTVDEWRCCQGLSLLTLGFDLQLQVHTHHQWIAQLWTQGSITPTNLVYEPLKW